MTESDRVALVVGWRPGHRTGDLHRARRRRATGGGRDLRTDEADLTAATIVDAGGDAVVSAIDVTDPASVERCVAEVVDVLGSIDILVNCAGWDEAKPFVATDEDFWHRVIDLNFVGVLRTVHACLPAMTDAGWGRIVNIASDAGRVGSSLEAVYSGAKGGVIAFTKTIAREVARRGVTANVVCPGPTDTPLLHGLVEAGGDSEKVIAGLTRAVPMKRLGQPADIAPAVAYLTSDAAGYVTGQTLSVSGGLTMI